MTLIYLPQYHSDVLGDRYSVPVANITFQTSQAYYDNHLVINDHEVIKGIVGILNLK